MAGSSVNGGNMRKVILISLAIVMLLSGCSYANREPVFTDSSVQMESSAAFLSLSDDNIGTNDSQEKEAEGAQEKAAEAIFVYVCGAVAMPGVYELSKGSRVIDAVNAAGGLTDEADETYVNLAASLEDGIKLRIPTIAETKGEQGSAQKSDAQLEVMTKSIEGNDGTSDKESALVNINTASVEQLKTLPGIGDAVAGRIVDYRTECGKFSCIEDIMKISGIKDKLFQKIKDRITV